VVDPGVGGDRAPAMVRADEKWFVGPDNGLLSIVGRRAGTLEARRIDWQPDFLSSSFHGRDLFAPVAAALAAGAPVESSPLTLVDTQAWPDDLAEIIYIDHYGNAMTGIRASGLPDSALIGAAGQRLAFRRTFSAGRDHRAFWYRNSLGLVEIAVNQDSAAERLGLAVGDAVSITDYERLAGSAGSRC